MKPHLEEQMKLEFTSSKVYYNPLSISKIHLFSKQDRLADLNEDVMEMHPSSP